MQPPQMIRPQQSSCRWSGRGFSEEAHTAGTAASSDAQVQQASWAMVGTVEQDKRLSGTWDKPE